MYFRGQAYHHLRRSYEPQLKWVAVQVVSDHDGEDNERVCISIVVSKGLESVFVLSSCSLSKS